MKILRTAYLFVFTLLISLSSNAQSDVKFVNEFLNIGVGARAHGMFGSVTATVDDITAAYWNPAGLSQINYGSQVSAMHASWFGGIANYDYLGYGKLFTEKNSGFGSITLIRMGIDNIPNTLNLIGPDGTVNYDNVLEFSAADYALFLSYGQNIGTSGLSIGGSAKVIVRSIGSFGSAKGFGFDFGAMYKKGRFEFGIMGRDITTTLNNWSFTFTPEEQVVFERTGNVIPVSSTEIALPKIIVSSAFRLGNKDRFSYLVEADVRFSTDGTEAGIFSGDKIAIDPSFGLEMSYNERLYFRAGIGNLQRTINETSSVDRSLEFQPNVGLGISLGKIDIDYALTNIGSVSGVLVSHIFSLKVNFNERSSTKAAKSEALDL